MLSVLDQYHTQQHRNFMTQRHSVARTLDVFGGICFFVGLCVCGFVCQHDNVRTTKHDDETWGRCSVQKFRPSSNLGVIGPRGAHPQNVAFGYDVGKISEGCLVYKK